MKYSNIVKQIKESVRKKVAEEETEVKDTKQKINKKGGATHVEISPTFDSIDQRR